MVLFVLMACGGEGEHTYASDFAYSLECNDLCTSRDPLEEFEATCDGDPADIEAECRSTCEQVLTGVALACAACIFDESWGWDNCSEAEWQIGSPIKCVAECG